MHMSNIFKKSTKTNKSISKDVERNTQTCPCILHKITYMYSHN